VDSPSKIETRLGKAFEFQFSVHLAFQVLLP
jgi:hypothetical protein